jgi:hypothetical protein
MDVKKIKNKKQYLASLARFEQVFQAKPGTPENHASIFGGNGNSVTGNCSAILGGGGNGDGSFAFIGMYGNGLIAITDPATYGVQVHFGQTHSLLRTRLMLPPTLFYRPELFTRLQPDLAQDQNNCLSNCLE